jgi:hypothetical protein
MNLRLSALGIVFTTVLLFAGGAQAELVTNGGFETGDFTGWTQFGNPSNTGVANFAVHTGSFGAFFAPPTPGGIFQTLPTVAGQTYDVTFFFQDTGFPPNTFEFNWDGGPAEWTNLNILPGFTTLHFQLPASSNATDLRFTFSGPVDGFWFLDDVSVTAAAPGPASLALLGLGLLALAATRRRLH